MTADVRSSNDSTNIGILFTGAVTSATATSKATSQAYLGDQAQVDSQQGDTTFRAVTIADAIADAKGVGVSLGVSVGATNVTADLEPTAKAFSSGGGSVTGRNITFNARVNVDAGGNGSVNGPEVTPVYGTPHTRERRARRRRDRRRPQRDRLAGARDEDRRRNAHRRDRCRHDPEPVVLAGGRGGRVARRRPRLRRRHRRAERDDGRLGHHRVRRCRRLRRLRLDSQRRRRRTTR